MSVAARLDTIEALLRQVVAGQAAIWRAIERGRGPRDRADARVILAIAETLGERNLTCAQIWAHRDASATLRDAIDGADIETSQELGCLFRRVAGIVINGLRLELVASKSSNVWRVKVCEDSIPESPSPQYFEP